MAALPPPSAALPPPSVADYARALGVRPGADAATINDAFHAAAMQAHPDRGGSEAAFDFLVEARDALKKHAYEQQWGTSNSAYGAGVAERPKLLDYKRGAAARNK